MISASLASALATFSASVSAASPLDQASGLTKAALVNAGRAALAQVDLAVVALAPTLDAAEPTGFAGDMVTGLLALSTANDDQAALVEIRGYVGRAAFNLAQA